MKIATLLLTMDEKYKGSFFLSTVLPERMHALILFSIEFCRLLAND